MSKIVETPIRLAMPSPFAGDGLTFLHPTEEFHLIDRSTFLRCRSVLNLKCTRGCRNPGEYVLRPIDLEFAPSVRSTCLLAEWGRSAVAPRSICRSCPTLKSVRSPLGVFSHPSDRYRAWLTPCRVVQSNGARRPLSRRQPAASSADVHCVARIAERGLSDDP